MEDFRTDQEKKEDAMKLLIMKIVILIGSVLMFIGVRRMWRTKVGRAILIILLIIFALLGATMPS